MNSAKERTGPRSSYAIAPDTGTSELVFEAVPAQASQLAPIRGEMSRFARELGLAENTAYDFVLASYEAMVNVVEHAYPADVAGRFDLRAVHDRGRLAVTVRDHGRWMAGATDPTLHRGRGLVLMRSCSDSVEIIPGVDGAGTQVTLRWNDQAK